jgi:HPr kinase/phosphorylase
MLLPASCVAVGNRALLIAGRPGSGKSALALDLLALGATLVADDQVELTRAGDTLLAAPPPRLAGLIEARGLGLLRVPYAAPLPVLALLDLDETEPQRLPVRRSIDLLGCAIPRILRPDPVQPAAFWAMLCHGLPLDPEAPLDPPSA